MTEAAFREAMVAQVATLTASIEMLKTEMREMSKAQWERIEDRFRAQEAATGIALTAAEKAVVKAEILATARSAQQDERISDLSTRADLSQGSGKGISSAMGWVMGGLMTLIAAATIILELTATR